MHSRREVLSSVNLMSRGIESKYCTLTINDFDTNGSNTLKDVKDFMTDYLQNLPKAIEKNTGIFFYGSNGVGKTFLASLIVKEAYALRYSSERRMFSSYVSLYTASWKDAALLTEELELVRRREVLVLEEIGKEIDTKITAPILEELLRYRSDHNLLTIVCTNLTLSDIEKKYGVSIASLLKGMCIPICLVAADRRLNTFKYKLEDVQ